MRKGVTIGMMMFALVGSILSGAFMSGSGEGGGAVAQQNEEEEYVPSVTIEGVGEFEFDPDEIETVREDIFVIGSFSLFDILVHLDENGTIDMEYHFNRSMNTHVIDSIEGLKGWWYYAFYDGGWPEDNVFRMDHYPWKNGTTFNVYQEDREGRISNIHRTFRDEVSRKARRCGQVVIPKVIIRGRNSTKTFEDVRVKAHDLRNDTFQKGVITAIDVIMSLGDEGEIDYQLKWYDSIGSADIVKNYWVEGIDEDIAYRSCGFVYESGSEEFHGFVGNHIHIPSDWRVINSPEYVEFFWICL